MGEFHGSIDYLVDRSRVFRNQNTHRAIILHGTGGNPNQTVEQLGDYFRTNEGWVASHYGIGRDGRIAQYVHESDGATANGILEAGYDPFWDQFSDNPNQDTLSVECINDSANSLSLTDPQEATLFSLVKSWVDKYHIPLTHIKGHFSLQPTNRARCPGPAFPWQKLFDYLQSGEEEQEIVINLSDVSNFFVQASNGAWHCPSTKSTIGGAILDFYRKFGNSGLNGLTHIGLPKTSEIGGVPDKTGVVFQRFERAVLIFDPQHVLDFPPGSDRVYFAHIDSGIGQDPRVTDLQERVTDLQRQIVALQQGALASENASLKARIAEAVEVLQG